MSKREQKKQVAKADTYARSNTMIHSKGRNTLLGNKLIAIGLFHIQKGNYVTTSHSGNITVSLPVTELRKHLGYTGNSIYRTLKSVAPKILSYTIGYEDIEQHIFSFTNVFTRAYYEDGVFSLVFNGDLKPYLLNMENRFTVLNLDLMLHWKNAYSYRLYELLISRAYGKSSGQYELSFQLAELKFMMGCYDANTDYEVRALLDQSKTPDYELAERKLKPTINIKTGKKVENGYRNYSAFKRNALEPAIKEINESSDALFFIHNIKTEAKGLGGKIYKIIFLLHMKEKISESKEEETLSEIEKFKVKSFAFTLFEPYALGLDEIEEICKLSDYQEHRIQTAYDVLITSTCDIHNVTGFVKSAIVKEYQINKGAAKMEA